MTQHEGSRKTLSFLNPVLLWIAVGFLVVLNLLIHRELSIVRGQLEARHLMDRQWPLSAQEAAVQFEENATLHPIRTTVKDVRYSPKADSYKIDFSWTNSNTNQTWSTDVELTGDGYGAYFGQIRSAQFIDPLGHENAFYIGVKTPSHLED